MPPRHMAVASDTLPSKRGARSAGIFSVLSWSVTILPQASRALASSSLGEGGVDKTAGLGSEHSGGMPLQR